MIWYYNSYWSANIRNGPGNADGAQEEEIKALFDMIDKDKSGSLSERVNIFDTISHHIILLEYLSFILKYKIRCLIIRVGKAECSLELGKSGHLYW